MSQKTATGAGNLDPIEEENASEENGNTLAENGGTPQLNNGNTTQGNAEMTLTFHLGLPSPEPLDLRGRNVSENWKNFKQKYTNYEIATGVNTKESSTRVVTLLTVISKDAIDVFNPLTWDAEDDDKKKIDKVLKKLEE